MIFTATLLGKPAVAGPSPAPSLDPVEDALDDRPARLPALLLLPSIRTANVIESPFATVRLRQRVTSGTLTDGFLAERVAAEQDAA